MAQNCDGRPAWEPPIFDYSQWIGEEYENKRTAMLKYLNDDVARTTEAMDIATEDDLLTIYWSWAYNIVGDAADHESKAFFRALWKEVDIDSNTVFFEWGRIRAPLSLQVLFHLK